MHFNTDAEYLRAYGTRTDALSYDGATKYYKLIDAQDSAMRFFLPHTENGKAVYRNHMIYPRTRYTTYIDDELFMNSLLSAQTDMQYTPEREEILKHVGVQYDLVICKACGGKVKKLKYCPVEVVDEHS